ncbi:MAG: hypothetical protein U9Q87_14030 [Pseudomonadota bacterium]|nr:hypothetical protein [Pseudomonadota bacterium]
MQNITKLFRFITYLYISFILRKKKVLVICGMRRSGNHACINWLLNSLEEVDTSFFELDGDRVSVSESRKTLFFNEASFYRLRFFLGLLHSSKTSLRCARNVIISLEDYTPSDEFSPYAPKGSTIIVVKRTPLNLIASRLQRALNQAKNGKDRGDMSIDEIFFQRLHWINRQTDLDSLVCWSFDEWLLDNEDYRQKFLEKLGLHFNLPPKISTHGGGSSFTGKERVPSTGEIQNRWNSIEWPERVLKLLKENSSLLNENEINFLSEK